MRKKLSYAIIFIIIIAVAIVIHLRWNAWFGSSPEPKFVLSNGVSRVILTPREDGKNSRTINWVSGQEQAYVIHLTKNRDSVVQTIPAICKEIKSKGGITYMYHVSLDSLPPAEYHYSIIDKSSKNQTLFRSSFAINTKEIKDTLIYIGDVQEVKESEDYHIFNHIDSLYPNATAWLFGGDAIERGYNNFWDLWYSSVSRFAPHIPIVAVTGNHEYYKGIIKTLDSRWVNSFNYPLNGPKVQIGREYFIDYPAFRLICMDSDGINLGPSLFQTRNWLKRVLLERPDVFHILMFHHGIYSVRKGRLNAIMRYGFRSIIEDPHYKVDLVLQGHDHAYSRIITKSQKETLRTPVYIISACSPKCYENGFDKKHDKIGSGLKLYQVISIAPDTLKYSSYLDNGQLYDRVQITKNSQNTRTVYDLGKDIDEIYRYQFENTKEGQEKRAHYLKEIEQRKAYLRNRDN